MGEVIPSIASPLDALDLGVDPFCCAPSPTADNSYFSALAFFPLMGYTNRRSILITTSKTLVERVQGMSILEKVNPQPRLTVDQVRTVLEGIERRIFSHLEHLTRRVEQVEALIHQDRGPVAPTPDPSRDNSASLTPILRSLTARLAQVEDTLRAVQSHAVAASPAAAPTPNPTTPLTFPHAGQAPSGRTDQVRSAFHVLAQRFEALMQQAEQIDFQAHADGSRQRLKFPLLQRLDQIRDMSFSTLVNFNHAAHAAWPGSQADWLREALLPAIDAYRAGQALSSEFLARDDLKQDPRLLPLLKSWPGVYEAVADDVQRVLEKFQLIPIEPMRGERFDPHQHQALGLEKAEDMAPQRVARTARRGYRQQEGTVIRKADVMVSQ
jgi:hypothetical protein